MHTKVVDPRIVPLMIELRLRHFEKALDAINCRQTALMWEKLNRTDPDSLYKSACLRAITAGMIRVANKSSALRQSDDEAERAMTWLKQAVAAGYKNAVNLNKDNDLVSLRDREDFKQLVAELERVKASEKAKP